MCFIILCAARSQRLASRISAINLRWRRGEWCDRERRGGCGLNFSWFSMILKILSRNSKVALNRTECCWVRYCILFYYYFRFRFFAVVRRCAVCKFPTSFHFILFRARVSVYWWWGPLPGSFSRSNWFRLFSVFVWCFFVRIGCGRHHCNVSIVGERTIDLMSIQWQIAWSSKEWIDISPLPASASTKPQINWNEWVHWLPLDLELVN